MYVLKITEHKIEEYYVLYFKSKCNKILLFKLVGKTRRLENIGGKMCIFIELIEQNSVLFEYIIEFSQI